MAAFPTVVTEWVSEQDILFSASKLGAALREFASTSGFESEKQHLLSKLEGTLLGYEDARVRVAQRLRSVIGDRGNAVSAFNQNVAVQSPEVRRIRRSDVAKELDAWWDQWRECRKHCVLIGEEGMGKSWAAMGWVADRIGTDCLPIFLPFSGSAEAIGPDDTETLVPKLLCKWTGRGTEESWKQRLKRWLDTPNTGQPYLLLLADGLSERPGIEWASFFRSLEDEKWRTRVAVLATDRLGHWMDRCARGGLGHFHSIRVDGYTDEQLRMAIEGSGMDSVFAFILC
jgi:hypothetical protein